MMQEAGRLFFLAGYFPLILICPHTVSVSEKNPLMPLPVSLETRLCIVTCVRRLALPASC